MGGTKFDNEKLRWDLLPLDAVEEVVAVLTYGAKKYEDHNWRKGFKYSRLIAAAMRHIVAFAQGENIDEESDEFHLAHAVCCLLFLIEHVMWGYGEDDRVKFGEVKQ